MDLEVVGRHALLFDDDASAAFVNSTDALVDWNSLSIDRYDVRHLLSGPLPPRTRRRNPDASLEPDLDHERYLDLPSPSDEQEQDVGEDAEPVENGTYRAVGFSYGNPDESIEQKISDAESAFHPTFHVPDSLIQHLPPTEKVHQIIARTAIFVSKHGGQSEIVLRVKQGDNPTFGFLMPDHHLHAYFRFLVDHQELLKPDIDGKSLEEEKKVNSGSDQTGGALSLLGSVYGSGEDEDGATEDAPKENKNMTQVTSDAVRTTGSQGSEQMESSRNSTVKDEAISNNVCLPKEKVHVIKRNQSISTVKIGSKAGLKKDGDASGLSGSVTNKSQASALPSKSKIDLPIVEPPSEVKRVVEKIVEFILRNGKEFEAVLAEQDRQFGRFPFLLPSNQYHPYYLKVLKKSQEFKLPGKGSTSEKHELMGHGVEKKAALRREGDTLSSGSAADSDIPCDYDMKFRMVLGKSKKDEQDPPSKTNQPQLGVSVDADAAAAILKAATRGIRNPSLGLFSKSSSRGTGQNPSNSQPQSSTHKSEAVGEARVSVPVAKIIAETAAVAAAGEADSSEASLTKEQKLKAERLKRAKMFAAMIKSGVAPLRAEPLSSLSVEPGSRVSSPGNDILNIVSTEREGSSVPVDVETSEKNEKSDKNASLDDSNERRSKRSYRSRSKRREEEEEEEEDDDDDRDNKHQRKKHRSHRSSRHSRDDHKHRRRHSSKDRDYHHHKHDKYSDNEDRYSRYRHKPDSSSDDDGEHSSSRKRYKYRSSSDDEHRHSRRRHKDVSSSDDEYQHRRRSDKHRKSHSKREVELEEGEIYAKSDQSKANESDQASREASVDISKSHEQERAPSQPSEPTEVSDDLRAKIRAMLMATL